MSHEQEVADQERFEFGRNWLLFLNSLNDSRIESATQSLARDLGAGSLAGKTFLDIGCGSGLFSLAARRLGAAVYSFDYDPSSVACAKELRSRYFPADENWQIGEGSVLDDIYLGSLGRFDIVYSWGVLHHTGDMWRALHNAANAVGTNGRLFLAIYNDCGEESRKWLKRKRRYNMLPSLLRPLYALASVASYEFRDFASSVRAGSPGRYIKSWTNYESRRGMSRWRDIVDWAGGYPYEFASSAQLVSFFRQRDFHPILVREAMGLGCHELIFERSSIPRP